MVLEQSVRRLMAENSILKARLLQHVSVRRVPIQAGPPPPPFEVCQDRSPTWPAPFSLHSSQPETSSLLVCNVAAEECVWSGRHWMWGPFLMRDRPSSPPFFLLQGIPADVEHLLDGAMSLKTPPQHFLRPHPRESTEGAREPSPMDLLAPLTGAPARAGAMTPGSALPQPHGVSDRARGTPLCTPVRRLGQSSASGPSPWCRIGAGRGEKGGGWCGFDRRWGAAANPFLLFPVQMPRMLRCLPASPARRKCLIRWVDWPARGRCPSLGCFRPRAVRRVGGRESVRVQAGV